MSRSFYLRDCWLLLNVDSTRAVEASRLTFFIRLYLADFCPDDDNDVAGSFVRSIFSQLLCKKHKNRSALGEVNP